VMLGITAGRKGKTCIGDVIIPQQVWDYGAGKWELTNRILQFRARPESEPIDEDIRQSCERMKDDLACCEEIFNDPMKPVQKRQGKSIRPQIQIGSMVSGAAVVNAKPIWERIREQNDTVIALDMEAYGLALATRLAKTSRYKPEWLIAKSVCDYGQGKKDSHQSYAARASARFFRKYLENFILAEKASFPRVRHNVIETE